MRVVAASVPVFPPLADTLAGGTHPTLVVGLCASTRRPHGDGYGGGGAEGGGGGGRREGAVTGGQRGGVEGTAGHG